MPPQCGGISVQPASKSPSNSMKPFRPRLKSFFLKELRSFPKTSCR